AQTTWKVGDLIHFRGSATDEQDGDFPESALSWSLVLQHCPSNCHPHTIQDYVGVDEGSFAAPDHGYPSYLELRLTVTDSGGLRGTANLRLDPKTVVLTFLTRPSAMVLTVNGVSSRAVFTRTVIVGSTNTLSAKLKQKRGGLIYSLVSWSDGGAPTHTITAPEAPTTYTATYRK
ncbi:MAG: hypothetical protein ACRD21_19645, partial [Vicinamibacteria bacterium]